MRTLLVVAVLSIVAVASLGWMAGRYARLVPTDAEAAVAEVDAYLLAMKTEIELAQVPSGTPEAAPSRHRQALETAGIDSATFKRVASFARRWRRGETVPRFYREAFEQRRELLKPAGR